MFKFYILVFIISLNRNKYFYLNLIFCLISILFDVVVKECEGCVQDCISLGNHTFGCPKKEKKLNTGTIAVIIGKSSF